MVDKFIVDLAVEEEVAVATNLIKDHVDTLVVAVVVAVKDILAAHMEIEVMVVHWVEMVLMEV